MRARPKLGSHGFFLVVLAVISLTGLAATPSLAADATKSLIPPREQDFPNEYDALHAVLAYHENIGRLSGLDYGLPPNDFDDVTNLTLRQRRAFRELRPGTRTEGVYQYPRWAFDLMNRIESRGQVVWNGEIVDVSSLPPSALAEGGVLPTAVVIGANLDVSNNSQVESETNLNIDPTNQQYLVGSANNITNDPQMIFRSSDWGATWATTLLPLVCTFHSDPYTGFDLAGNVYSSTLEYSTGCGNQTRINYFRSTDHGATWSAGFQVFTDKNSDKQLNTIDTLPSSPCAGHHYMGWDIGSEMVGAAATWNGAWTIKANVDSNSIGTDLATGPNGEVYSVFAKTTGQIRFIKSTDCGTTWSAAATVASTADTYDYGIPAQCMRRVLVYPSVDVDRTNGPRSGWVYVVWNDFTAANTTCISASDTNTANIWFSRSTDGGASWSAKTIIHENDTVLPRVDQFNQWMRVDDADGAIHVSWHDTRNDATRAKSDIYYARSFDGGTTFETPMKITTALSDESTGNGNQYGDYEGLAVRNGVAYPFWTDRRGGTWGTDEEIATSRICSDPKVVGATTAVDDACGGIAVSWSLPTIFWGDGGAGTRKFQLYRDGVLVLDNITEGTTSHNHVPGNTSSHSYQIRAVNSCGNVSSYAVSGSVSDLIAGDVTAPSGVLATLRSAKSGGNAHLSWNASSSPDVANYRMYRAATGGASFPSGWTLIATTPSLFFDDPLAGAGGCYMVSAVDACGNESSPY